MPDKVDVNLLGIPRVCAESQLQIPPSLYPETVFFVFACLTSFHFSFSYYMPSDQVPRTSIDTSLHGAVDNELKALKLHTRRLQSVLTTRATELQILQRLYYKNKNQHRGALFWRNVVEIKRFLERVEHLNLLDSINGLRSMFYESQK